MNIIKKFKAIIIAAILMLPFGVILSSNSNLAQSASEVPIEAKLEVGNTTTGTGPASAVNAKVDEVVNVTSWYHNPALPDSGKVAQNVNIRINIPSVKTKNHQVTSRVAGSNTNIVNNIATVNTTIATNLTYIPGTATRKYNSGTNEHPVWKIEKISDSVVTSGYNVQNLRPCWNFQESINVQVRVTAPVLTITKKVKIEDADSWQTSVIAKPGDTLAFLITVKNEGNERLTNVIVRDSMPQRLNFVSGSARLTNLNYPNGYQLSDNFTNGGANIGNYAVGAMAYIRLNATVSRDLTKCGRYEFQNRAFVRSDQIQELGNTAIVTTDNACVQNESGLQIIKYHDRDGDRTQDANEERLSGWRFRVVGNDVDKILTTDSNGMATLNGIEAGSYTVTEILISGWTNTTGLSVQKTITDGATVRYTFGNRRIKESKKPGGDINPKELPKSGPAEAAMAFGTISFSGTAVAWVKSKKNLRNAFRK